MEADASDGAVMMAASSGPPRRLQGVTQRPTELLTIPRRHLGANVSSSSSSSSESGDDENQKPKRNPVHNSLKKAAEKKFRKRYLLLQQAYEHRLQALASQVRHVVAELQIDSTIPCLQEDPLTTEYAHARIAEIIQESFFGEREKYIKIVTDQFAWQTNDLRDAEQQLRTVQRKEKAVQQKYKQTQMELQEARRQLDLHTEEAKAQYACVLQQREKIEQLTTEREQCRLQVERMQHTTESLHLLRLEYDAFKVRAQNESEQNRSIQEDLKHQLQQLREARDKADSDRKSAEQHSAHLEHLLALAEKKNDELSRSILQVHAEEFPTKLLKLEHTLEEQRRVNTTLEKENEHLKKRYEEFGEQVETYMEEQAQTRAALVKKADEQTQELRAEIGAVRQQGIDAVKAKHNELLRIADQVKFRQDALTKAEQKNAALEERVNALETMGADEKLRQAKAVSDMEKEISQLRLRLEKEQEKIKEQEARMVEVKQGYEHKIAAMQEAHDQQQHQSLKERELEARTRWQNDFVAKQEARIESLKNKYDAALEAQQNELLRARQIAIDAAKSATEKVEEVKAQHQNQREDAEEARRLREEARDAERQRAEIEKARETEHRKQLRELDEREKRLIEREQLLLKKERDRERRKAAEEAVATAAGNKKSEVTPSVVVLNMNASEDQEHEEKIAGGAIAIVNKRNAPRPLPRASENNQETDIHEDCVPRAQHKAELQAHEAQIALEAEKRVQKQMQEFQERKEREMRNAMVNVRKGIQKLEASLENEKAERKRFEEELFSERQEFVTVKSNLEEAKEAKRTMAQRLEEANNNIGRLRDLVKDALHKQMAAEERMRAAQDATARTTQDKEELQNHLDQVKKELKSCVSELKVLRAEVQTSRNASDGFAQQVEILRKQLEQQAKHFEEELAQANEDKVAEMGKLSSELWMQIRALEVQLEERSGQSEELEARSSGAQRSIEELRSYKEQLERKLEETRADQVKQRERFNDLARMYKSSSESMKAKLQEEQQKQEHLERALDDALQQRDRVKNNKRKALEACHLRVQRLEKECQELRERVASEMQAALSRFLETTRLAGAEANVFLKQALQAQNAEAHQHMEKVVNEWRVRVEEKEKELLTVLAHQKVDDQTKFDQLMTQLEHKSLLLQQADDEKAALAKRASEFEQIVKKLEHENELRALEQFHLADRLSSSQSVTEREAEEKQQLRESMARVSNTSKVLLTFVLRLMKDQRIDKTSVEAVQKRVGTGPESWDAEALQRDLSKLRQQVNDKVQTQSTQATEAEIKSLQVELDAAKAAFKSLVKAEWSASDGFSEHLPWYVAAVRAVKMEMARLAQEIEHERAAVVSREMETKGVSTSAEKLQQTIAALEFEKETLKHELNLHLQTLQKKRDQDLQDQREDYERRLEQLQRRHGKEQMKVKEEHQLTIEQLTDSLETERKKHAKLKQDTMTARVDLERLQGELEERPKKLEKEISELRDELVKWKRKAKLATKSMASLTPGTPGRHMSMLFASSFHGTDDGSSDASHHSLLPTTPRRPSTAMSDLSNLMEQSLQDLRKDNEEAQQHTPRYKLHLPKTPRSSHPSPLPIPLRIPIHPSPMRRRSSLSPRTPTR
ncbi:hypothetical protein Poli38472_003177 [Pythium oligandrum]|uniref:Uncharacterized protein n=1 Tax=Pythium oligandrum TaxID=41045 RepID=A0A8K1C744_PYTOL|nr:hypothetical protein Poli38472_003177 [Pythium oligandrum]|eukprot:TMW57252.1 hypothetical protein Poli38472_003177 [Pythium oligandrum]